MPNPLTIYLTKDIKIFLGVIQLEIFRFHNIFTML